MIVPGLDKLHREHVQESSDFVDGFIFAAVQSNGLNWGVGADADAGVGAGAGIEVGGADISGAVILPEDGAAETDPGRGASHMVHFSFALSGLFNWQRSHTHCPPLVLGGFRVTAAQSNATLVLAGMATMSNTGRVETGAANAALRGVSKLEPARQTVSFTVNVYLGSSWTPRARASLLGDEARGVVTAAGDAWVTEGDGVTGTKGGTAVAAWRSTSILSAW